MASKGKRTAGKAPATREYKSFKFELESADEGFIPPFEKLEI